MPWFYFHLRTSAGLEVDDLGVELAGLEAAYLEVCQTVPVLCVELMRQEANLSRCAFEITDAAGRLLMEVPFAEVLDRGHKPVRLDAAARRKVSATMDRTTQLIGALHTQHATLRANLAETWRLLDRARETGASPLWNSAPTGDALPSEDDGSEEDRHRTET